MRWKGWALLAAFVAPAALAQQNNCDCTQITGSCEAVIMLEPTDTAKGPTISSHSANLHIRSTAPVCSKVEYYVDSTPYFTVLSQGNSFTDRVFGTSPVTKDTITDIRCRTCKVLNASLAPSTPGSQPPQPQKRTIFGVWIGDGGRYELTGQGDQFSGTYKADERSDTIRVTEGAVSGDSFTYRVPSDYGSRNVVHSCKFQSETEASCTWQATGGMNPIIYLLAPKSGSFVMRKQQ
jgi:hypothetical protein